MFDLILKIFANTEDDGTALFIFFFILPMIILIIFLIFIGIRKRYENFINQHSKAIKNLREINSRYSFTEIPNMDLEHSYDNENFYNHISCQDYLIYYLTFLEGKILKAEENARKNIISYDKYEKEIKEKCEMAQFDSDKLPINTNLLLKTELRIFKKEKFDPQTKVEIKVTLIRKDMGGSRWESKTRVFSLKEIKELLVRVHRRNGEFYLDDGIWKSICRVECGKVTNRMRFSIYRRDGHRCRKCRRRTNDLEIDHIIPISKGGKSTYDNLQTLCHRCNAKKGSNID